MTSLLHESLHGTPRLPSTWSELDVVCDCIIADGVELRRAGLASTGPSGEEVRGSAAEFGSSPLKRGHFELLERVSTLEFMRVEQSSYELLSREGKRGARRPAEDVFPASDDPGRWRYARSNGVALHTDWQSACDRARWELAERDRVLRAWYGEIRPERVSFGAGATPIERAPSYAWHAYSFPESPGATWSRGVHVAAVFGFPRRPEVPLIFGYGSRQTPGDALEAAAREATQLLAFLWGEAIPAVAPDPGPTPMHHLERLLFPENHEILRRWLQGEHLRYDRERGRRLASISVETAYVDLTPAWLRGKLYVAKAVHPSAVPLAFGDAPFAAHLPPPLRPHPIA